MCLAVCICKPDATFMTNTSTCTRPCEFSLSHSLLHSFIFHPSQAHPTNPRKQMRRPNHVSERMYKIPAVLTNLPSAHRYPPLRQICACCKLWRSIARRPASGAATASRCPFGMLDQDRHCRSASCKGHKGSCNHPLTEQRRRPDVILEVSLQRAACDAMACWHIQRKSACDSWRIESGACKQKTSY